MTMDDFFTAREQTMIDLKNTLREGELIDTNKDVLNELKQEMIILMQEDIKLWHQLSDLNKSINDLKEEFFLTRCRSSSYGFGPCTDQAILDEETQESRPRAFSLNSSFVETNRYTAAHFLFYDPFFEKINSNILTDRTMKEIRYPSSIAERKYSFLNLFNPLNIKPVMNDTNISSFKNNMFLSSLHVGLVNVVDDLIKPLTSKHILPRRKLHRQSNVLATDITQNELFNLNSNVENVDYNAEEPKSNGQVSYERDKNRRNSSESSQLTKDKQEDADDRYRHTDSTNEPKSSDKNDACKVSSEELAISGKETDQSEDEEVEDISSSYLIFEDGYVSCRIMTPGLEEEIKLKHEREGEPLEYLKCKSGFARFRSGYDSESSYSVDSYQTDEKEVCQSNRKENNQNVLCDDALCDIKYMFDFEEEELDSPTEVYTGINYQIRNNCENTEIDNHTIKCETERDKVNLERTVEENMNLEMTVEDINDIEVPDAVIQQSLDDEITELSQNTVIDLVEVSPLNEKKLDDAHSHEAYDLAAVKDTEYNVDNTDAERLQLSVNDTVTITSREVLMDGLSVFVYKEKQCNFTYRISSVDSGIGDEITD